MKTRQAPPQADGEQQHHEHARRADQERDLDDPAPGAADGAHVIAAQSHEQQVHADDQEGGGVKHHLPRNENVDRPLRIASQRQRYERRARGGEQAAQAPHRAIDAAQQLRLRVEEEVVREHTAQPECEIAQRRARSLVRIAEDLLEEDQAEQHR